MHLLKIAPAILALGLMACGSSGGAKKADTDDIPEWFMAPPPGCAPATAKYRGNLQAAMTSATQRGRAELGAQLQVRIQGLVKEYIQSGEADAKDFTEELSTQVSKGLVDTSLSGSRARLQKVGEGDPQQFYSLVCLDPGSLAGALDGMKQLQAKDREALKKRADAAFKDLDAQLEKFGSK